jgi:hypothetical protein
VPAPRRQPRPGVGAPFKARQREPPDDRFHPQHAARLHDRRGDKAIARASFWISIEPEMSAIAPEDCEVGVLGPRILAADLDDDSPPVVLVEPVQLCR